MSEEADSPLRGKGSGALALVHLDTSFLIEAEQPNTPAALATGEWLKAGVSLRASLLVWAEYLAGATREAGVRHWRAVLDGFEPVTETQCEHAARLRSPGDGSGRRLIDCMIAAATIECGAALATINRRDFEGFRSQGLELAMEIWRDSAF